MEKRREHADFPRETWLESVGVPCRARNSSYAAMPLLGFENLCPAAIPAINYGNLENPPLIYRYLQYLVGGIPTPLKNDGVRQLG